MVSQHWTLQKKIIHQRRMVGKPTLPVGVSEFLVNHLRCCFESLVKAGGKPSKKDY